MPVVSDAWVGRSVASVTDCLWVCVTVHTLKEKQLEQLTPNLLHIWSMAAVSRAKKMRSKRQHTRSHGYQLRWANNTID